MTNDKSNIIVSICCITYNHAPFIRKALDGFLMQEPPTGVSKDEPWYEILIHDDASTDGTDAIICEYAAKYPDRIFPLYEEINQYSHGGKGRMDLYNYNRVRGKYIAYCEGDDYWTDPKKLQKQVDFMESHPDYSICLHGYTKNETRTNKISLSCDFERYAQASNKSEEGLDITAKDYLDGYFGQPLTMVFRMSMFDFKWRDQYQYYRDTHEIYHLLRAGKGYWMNFDGGVYNLHGGGISAAASLETKCWEEREHVMELYLHNRGDKELRAYLVEILLWNHDVFKREGSVREFYKVVRPYREKVPRVMAQVYWTVLKRNIKKRCKR